MFDQLAAIASHAVIIIENTEPRVVQDINFAFEILQPENREEFLREYSNVPVRVQAQDTSFRRICLRETDIHGIFGDENAAIWRASNDRRMPYFGRFSHQFNSPGRRGLGKNRRGNGPQGHKAKQQGETNASAHNREFATPQPARKVFWRKFDSLASYSRRRNYDAF